MPLCIEPLFIQISLDMSGFMLAVAGLGFLGLGAQPPIPEWGTMISSARDYGFEHWWVFTFPGIAIVLLSLGFNLIGEGLKYELDPRNS
jgi:peptide/nickel transport system permease protein